MGIIGDISVTDVIMYDTAPTNFQNAAQEEIANSHTGTRIVYVSHICIKRN